MENLTVKEALQWLLQTVQTEGKIDSVTHEGMIADCAAALTRTPGIYIYVEGGNIQGISATEPMTVNIFDADNYEDDLVSPADWDALIATLTESGDIAPIY